MQFSRLLCIACLVVFVSPFIQAQELSTLPAFYPSRYKTYAIEDGLPDNCIYSAQLGNDGRLNLIPCNYLQIAQGIQFMQTDGFSTQYIRIPFPDSMTRFSVTHTGTDSDGTFYGYCQDVEAAETEYAAAVWKYNPATGAISTQKLLSTDDMPIHAYNVIRAEDQFYILGIIPGSFVICTLRDSQLKELVRIPTDIIASRNAYSLPCLITSTHVLFYNGQQTVYAIDRNTFNVASIDFSSDVHKSVVVSDRLIKTISGDILLGLPGTGIAYKAGLSGGELAPVTFAELGFSASDTRVSFIFSDHQGGVLAIGESPSGALEAVMQDSSGKFWNYTPVISAIPDISTEAFRFLDLQSADFRRSVFVTGNVFMAIDVSARSGILAIPGTAMRGIAELTDDLLYAPRQRIFSRAQKRWLEEAPPPECLDDAILDSDLRADAMGNLWLFVKPNLTRYNRQTGQCDVVIPGPIKRFIPIGTEKIVFATSDGMIMSYDVKTHVSTALSDSPVSGYINEIFADADQRIWIASSDGLLSINNTTRKLEQVWLPVSHDAQQVICISQDVAGRFWLGTFSHGLIVYDPDNDNFDVINEDMGLSNNTVASILADEDGIRWIGTYHGITLVDTALHIIGHVYREDGLVSNECNRWSSYITHDGSLCIGTPSGLSIIDPLKTKGNVTALSRPKIFLTQLTFDDTTISAANGMLNTLFDYGITLPASNRNLKLSYGLSNYTAPEQRRYAYRIEQAGQDWNYIGGVHDLALINLPHGSYHIRIKGSDYRGQWSSNEIVIPVKVLKYFYLNWWFYALCAVPFFLFGTLWIHRQRSEKKRLESEVLRRTKTIQQQTEELRALDKAKSRLYTNISHEFRTPLTVIRGLADRVEENASAPELIKRNADSVLNLVNQMLDLRKLESGHLKAEMVHADLIRYLSYIGESLRSLASLRHHQFHFLAPSHELLMDFDPDKIARIITNLVSNAIKFTPEGGDIYLQVDAGLSDVSRSVTIKVTDTGVGIPQDKLAHIFDRFYQVDDSTTRRGEGTGIGLTIVKEFVHLMGGTIEVQSRAGHGTTFVIVLPVTHDAPPADAGALTMGTVMTQSGIAPIQNVEALESNTESAGMPLVLIVEDNPDVVHYIGSCLKDNYRLSIAMDGVEGIDKAIELVPDVIISDVMMPGKNGFELCQTVKDDSRTSHIPVILLTAKADAESRLKGLKRGADAYLAKPFNEEELYLYIENMLASRAAMRSRYGNARDSIVSSDEPALEQEDAFILQFRETLLEHIDDENFGVSEMHQAMHISRTQLHNKISALTGKSASQYMRDIRLHEATKRMRESSLTISEVAYEVGFRDPKYFARVFKEEFGMTPTEYRERNV